MDQRKPPFFFLFSLKPHHFTTLKWKNSPFFSISHQITPKKWTDSNKKWLPTKKKNKKDSSKKWWEVKMDQQKLLFSICFSSNLTIPHLLSARVHLSFQFLTISQNPKGLYENVHNRMHL